MRLLLCRLLLIAKRVKAALHHRPEIDQDRIDRLTAGSGVIVVDRLIDQRDVLVELINILAGIAGQIVDLMRSHRLDQKIQHDRMVIVLAVDHVIDLRHSLSEAKVVQSDPFGGGARKLIRVPGIHISVFQNVAQCVSCAHDNLARDSIRIVLKCLQDVLGMELLHTIQARRLLRIELSLFQTAEEAVPNPVIRE